MLDSSISEPEQRDQRRRWTLSGAFDEDLSGQLTMPLWVNPGTLILNSALTAKGATVDDERDAGRLSGNRTLGAINGDIVDNAH